MILQIICHKYSLKKDRNWKVVGERVQNSTKAAKLNGRSGKLLVTMGERVGTNSGGEGWVDHVDTRLKFAATFSAMCLVLYQVSF